MGDTLYTTDYLEYYLTLVGWLVHNGIWSMIVASGVFALPFLVILIQEWLRVRGEGADEGNKGVLSAARIENRMLVAFAVIMFAGMPVIDVDMATLKFDESRSEQCQTMVPLPSQTGWSQSFTTLNQQSAKVPVWWFFVHALSRGLTAGAIAAIPCGTDLRQMRMEIDSTRIGDSLLAQEVADFSNDCYGPARARYFMDQPSLTEAQMYDVTWVGSRFFLDTAGYYDTYHAKTPRASWPYSTSRDAGLAQVRNGGGYPTCREWWADEGRGLRERLLAQVDPGLLQRFGTWAGYLSRAEVDDAVIRAVVSPRQQKMNQGSVYTDYGGQVSKTAPNWAARVVGDVGLGAGALVAFPAMDAVRQGAPMVLSLLKMALVVCIPALLIVGAYDLKLVMTVSCVQFALFFIDFWFQFGRWIDSTVLDALYGKGFGIDRPHHNLNPFLGLDNAFGDLLLNFVLGTMFLVLPTFWLAALSWAGIQAGSIARGLASGTDAAKSAGGLVGGMALRSGRNSDRDDKEKDSERRSRARQR
ncbi:conjugal transfer protein TraG N-terminal domain-containing protein [Pseudomonas aeruginosa]